MTGLVPSFVPPPILSEIARRGSERQREWALRTLQIDALLRTARLQHAPVRAAGALVEPSTVGDGAARTPNRTIVDAQMRERVDGPVVRAEGQPPTGDEAVDEAYDGLGATFAYFDRVHMRHSIDDAGMALRAVVHYGREYANAFWDGTQMVFGDGDGEVFSALTGSLDVIAHELAHGVTEVEAGLVYTGQSGALNESMSDVLGSLVKQYTRGETAEAANWLMGEDVWTPAIRGDALRSLKAPGTAYDDPLVGKDPQPAHMDDFVVTTQDNGGVHINSGIPNHAFYRVATTLGGHAWERAGLVWYQALVDPQVRPTTDFAAFAGVTVAVARRSYGDGSAEVDAVRGGWDAVGIAVA